MVRNDLQQRIAADVAALEETRELADAS